MQAADPDSGGCSQVASIQTAIMAVQECMQQHGGSFLQFRCDEKGFVSICAFGLPGKTHEDDPCRGIRAALDLVEALKQGVHVSPFPVVTTLHHAGMFLQPATIMALWLDKAGSACVQAVVGVTTGQLLCACVGSAIRSEYTVYGNAINLSARLMAKAAAGEGRVLCDSTTYLLAPKAAAFRCLQLLEVGWAAHKPCQMRRGFDPKWGPEVHLKGPLSLLCNASGKLCT